MRAQLVFFLRCVLHTLARAAESRADLLQKGVAHRESDNIIPWLLFKRSVTDLAESRASELLQ
jgi:hypothetical protein